MVLIRRHNGPLARRRGASPDPFLTVLRVSWAEPKGTTVAGQSEQRYASAVNDASGHR